MLHGPYGKDTGDSEVHRPIYQAAWKKLIANNPDLRKSSSCRFILFEATEPRSLQLWRKHQSSRPHRRRLLNRGVWRSATMMGCKHGQLVSQM